MHIFEKSSIQFEIMMKEGIAIQISKIFIEEIGYLADGLCKCLIQFEGVANSLWLT